MCTEASNLLSGLTFRDIEDEKRELLLDSLLCLFIVYTIYFVIFKCSIKSRILLTFNYQITITNIVLDYNAIYYIKKLHTQYHGVYLVKIQ